MVQPYSFESMINDSLELLDTPEAVDALGACALQPETIAGVRSIIENTFPINIENNTFTIPSEYCGTENIGVAQVSRSAIRRGIASDASRYQITPRRTQQIAEVLHERGEASTLEDGLERAQELSDMVLREIMVDPKASTLPTKMTGGFTDYASAVLDENTLIITRPNIFMSSIDSTPFIKRWAKILTLQKLVHEAVHIYDLTNLSSDNSVNPRDTDYVARGELRAYHYNSAINRAFNVKGRATSKAPEVEALRVQYNKDSRDPFDTPAVLIKKLLKLGVVES